MKGQSTGATLQTRDPPPAPLPNTHPKQHDTLTDTPTHTHTLTHGHTQTHRHHIRVAAAGPRRPSPPTPKSGVGRRAGPIRRRRRPAAAVELHGTAHSGSVSRFNTRRLAAAPRLGRAPGPARWPAPGSAGQAPGGVVVEAGGSGPIR